MRFSAFCELCLKVRIPEHVVCVALWAPAKVTRHPGHLAALAKAVSDIVDAECEVLPGPAPCQAWGTAMDDILRHTLLRTMCQVSGRVMKYDVPTTLELDELMKSPIAEPHRTRKIGAGLVKIINGNPRMPQLVHYCDGCCLSIPGLL